MAKGCPGFHPGNDAGSIPVSGTHKLLKELKGNPVSYEDEIDEPLVENVKAFTDAVVGHRIVNVTRDTEARWDKSTYITLDNGKVVELNDTSECCAYTALRSFLLNVDLVDHIITGVRTEDNYETWHIYADMGDVLKLELDWSEGNFPYYGYGFYINVRDAS